MSKQAKKLPVSIIRGGTSKGVYILQSDLPEEKDAWEPLLLRLMGSPDKKQIDGLGGSQSVTSKVAIIQKSDHPGADVDYTFAQVSVDKPLVSYKGNCGNISSGVGPFAIEKGLVEARDGMTSVRIFNTNTGKIIIADVQTPGGEVAYSGDFYIAGVPGTASPVKLKFVEPAGTLGHGLLPTGNAVDVLDVPGYGPVEVSIIDAANPLVFARARDLGLTGRELPDELNANAEKLELLEAVRGLAAVKLGLIEDYKRSAWDTPGIPKMTFVAEAEEYVNAEGKTIAKESIDLLSRMMSMQKAHPSYAMTGAMCTAAAAVLILLGAADEKKAIKGIPWGTLVFICGVGAFINVVNKLGGISMISDFLTSLMGAKTATPILAATSGILSWVSSTTGVVMPALFPIASEVVVQFPALHYQELIAAITATSFAAAISPLSTGGAIIMSSISASKETTNEENNTMFKNLFLLSVANVLVNVVLSALGVFSLGGLFY